MAVTRYRPPNQYRFHRVSGAVAALAGTITEINTPTRGWVSVTNPAAATVGTPAETDAELRIQSHHLAVFAVRFEVGITAINLLKIANQGAEYRLIIGMGNGFSTPPRGLRGSSPYSVSRGRKPTTRHESAYHRLACR